jgi:hypothetical protein
MFSKLTRGRKEQIESRNNENESAKDGSAGYSSSLINVLSTNSSKKKYNRPQLITSSSSSSSSSSPQRRSKVKLSVSNINNQGLRFVQKPKRNVDSISNIRVAQEKSIKVNKNPTNREEKSPEIKKRKIITSKDKALITNPYFETSKKNPSLQSPIEEEEEEEEETFYNKNNDDDVDVDIDIETEEEEEEEELMLIENKDDGQTHSPIDDEEEDDNSEYSEDTFEDVTAEIGITNEDNNDNKKKEFSSPSDTVTTITTTTIENKEDEKEEEEEEEDDELERLYKITHPVFVAEPVVVSKGPEDLTEQENQKKRKRNYHEEQLPTTDDKTNGNDNKNNRRRAGGRRHAYTLDLINYSSKKSPTHQRKAVNLIKNAMGYKDITILNEAVNAISSASNFFAEMIILGTYRLKQMKRKETISKDDVISTIIGSIPYSDFSVRLLMRLMKAVETYMSYVEAEGEVKKEEEEEKKKKEKVGSIELPKKRKSISDEIRAGLLVKISHVNNLIKGKVPVHRVSKLSKIAIASCIEEMQREIIHRCVGRLYYSAIPSIRLDSLDDDDDDDDGDDDDDIYDYHNEEQGGEEKENEQIKRKLKGKDTSIIMNQVRFTVDLEIVNIILKKFVSMDTLREIASEHELFRHRKLDKKKEIENAILLNNKKSSSKRKKIRDIKKRVIREVDKHNRENILEPGEIVFFFMIENLLPIIFRDFKLNGTRPIPNVRPDLAPEKMRKKCRIKIAGEKNYVKNENNILLMLDFLATTYIQSENGKNWAASVRA